MICNNSLTIYHLSGLDTATHFEVWTRYNYENAWIFGGKGASINKGYDNANDIEIRLPYAKNDNLNIENFAIGDIIVEGTLTQDIQEQQDLKNYLIYTITSIKDNKFGTKHIHIGGK